eukprot:CAMPEP_0201117308 /NCGR_PEP_ID=MMETSP0850-20130426/1291_1 /ASSEMBLY_ACC=CAM_ASM_000622 /TAXON_ID=183588 /ORGANISM="Pseudo-nitzschia fraudulenta, Strain WWA7" /LENGTH=441 /DNA_ID=CAMNT_0047381565 /DNA_START=121 /DNA_END=1446 /DNA_ORIENTATION=-
MILPRRKISSMFVLSVGIVSTLFCWMTRDAHALQEATVQKTEVRREHNLDHWDSDTLAYYLDNYPGYDLAIMFYARWDTNSQRLAPYWNRIAEILDAGSNQSKLIMALFDCELNAAHMQLCSSASVTHYPTMMFIGSGPFYDTDPVSKILFGKNSAGMMGESPSPNTVKFQGNWQYYDSVLDWIKTMQALSRWHTWSTEGFGKRLRTFFLPEKKKNGQLPLGLPSTASSSSSSSSSTAAKSGAASTSSASSESIAYLEKQIDIWKNATKDMQKAATRAATMMDTMLFADETSIDMFTYLDARDAWKGFKSYSTMDDIHRSCVLELSMDYCQRLADPVGTKVVDKLVASNLSSDELVAASDNIEKLIMEELTKQEPYCAILDNCILGDMKDEACRPKTCPFTNDIACKLLTSCQDPSVEKEYAEALKLDYDTLLAGSEAPTK